MRNNPLKILLTLGLAAIISCGSMSALASCSAQSTSSGNAKANSGSTSSSSSEKIVIERGTKAPDFTFTTIEGTTAKLSDYQGSVVLLNFWASWCGYCIQEMPAMEKIATNYPGVTIVAINRGDSASKALSTAQSLEYDFVWGLDEDGNIESLYPSNGIPYSIIIKSDGTISQVFNGSAADMYPHFEKAVVGAGA